MSKKDFLEKYVMVIILLLLIVAALCWSLRAELPQPAIGSSPPVSMFLLAMLMLLGVGAGFFGGLLGLGGGLIMLPILSFGMGFSTTMAVGTTLFAVIFTTISGGYAHLVRGNVHTRSSLLIALGGVTGISLGSGVFTVLTTQMKMLSLILGLFFIVPSLYMIWDALCHREPSLNVPGTPHFNRSKDIVFLGLTVGFLTGVLGLGGGFILVPGLTYLFGFPVQLAVGTTLTAVIPVTIAGGGIKLWQSYVLLPAALSMGLGTVIGAQFGAISIRYFKDSTLKLVFGLYFLYVAVRYIIDYWA
ncbi:MAG: sulfite exporter TauE/SafE family protein [Syntrophomonadaceae bacterium]|nr:sulfite exporter TauE/SafE family protein [Syntrophomonadaceae bacterium]